MRNSGWLLLVAALTMGSPAGAVPRVDVEGESRCPSVEQLKLRIERFSAAGSTDEPHFRLVVRQQTRGASIELYGPDGKLAFQRSIDSDECESLADAFAFIVRAHFLQLGLQLSVEADGDGQKNSASGEAPKNPTILAETATAPEPDAVTESTPNRSARSSARAARAPRNNDGSPAPADSPAWRCALAVAAGGAVDLPEPRFAAAAQVELAAQLRSLVLRAELFADTGTTSEATYPVRHQVSGFAVSAGVRRGTTLFIDPRLGAGVALARVKALGAPGAEAAWSGSPLGLLGLRGGYSTAAWGGWLDLSSLVFLKRDRYWLAPFGNVGLGPRWQARALIGAGIPW